MKKTLLLLGLFVALAAAGNKESQACNLCRKDINPPSHKFPDGYSSCGEFVGSSQCPIINTDEGGETVHTSASDDCHSNPYDQECSKWERKYGDKFNSTKKQNNNTTGIVFLEFTAGLVLAGLVFFFFMLVARASSPTTGVPIYNITANIEP